MQLSSSLVHWFLWQETDLDAFKSVGLCPITHSNVTVDPSGKLWVERSSAFKMTFLDAKEGCVHCAEEKNKSQAFNLMYTPVSQLVTWATFTIQLNDKKYTICYVNMLCLSRSLSVVKCVSGGMRWLFLTARTPYPLEWVREQSPLHMATADVGLVSCEWEGILYPTAAADVGLVSCEWECPLHTADRCWGAGIVWMSDEPSDCVLHTAERRSEVGGCMLRQWVFPCDMRTLSSRICPRLSMEGGREKPGWCLVLQVRRVRGMRT